jgi:aromatic-L-amino-acid decarboxylase
MADYLQEIERYPVRSQLKPGEVLSLLPGSAPEQGESFDEIMADLERIVLPGLTHWQHPRFFAYFPANASPPAILADMLTAAFGTQAMLWQTSPAATELETRVLDWLRQLVGLPSGFHGVIQDSASSATLCAIVTARERATDWRSDEEGLGAVPPLAVYASTEAHSSVEKALRIAGLGRKALRLIPTDERWRMRPDDLAAVIAQDRAKGITPACVVACFGSTGLGVLDPLDEIGAICRKQDIYLHVDAAWAGSALVLPEVRALARGIEQADSVVLNPHKWMLTNFDCSAHWVRDPASLVRTLGIMRAYFEGGETGQIIDYRDWSIQLGRRFRALKLWFVLRSYGAQAIRAKLRRDIELTAEAERAFARLPGFEIVTRSLALLVIRHVPPSLAGDAAAVDAHNRGLLERINSDGRIYLTPGAVNGRAAIRLAVGGTWTERRHVLEAVEVVSELAQR